MEILYLALLTIGSILAMVLLFKVNSYLKDRYLRSSYSTSFSYNDQLIIVSHIFYSGGDSGDAFHHTRITFIDVLSGRSMSQLIIHDQLELQSNLGSIIFFRAGKMFYCLDIVTGKMVFNRDIMYHKYPLAKIEHVHEIKLEDNSKIIITTLKGNQQTIDISDLTDWTFSASKEKPSPSASSYHSIPDAEISIVNNSFDKLLKPRNLLITSQTKIMMHSENLSDASPFYITTTNLSGQPLNSIYSRHLGIRLNMDDDNGTIIKHQSLHGNILVLCFDTRRDVAIGVNINDGRLMWKYRI